MRSTRDRKLGTAPTNHEPDVLATRRIHERERPAATLKNPGDFRSERLAEVDAKNKIVELRS
jgi:hypothetical protein